MSDDRVPKIPFSAHPNPEVVYAARLIRSWYMAPDNAAGGIFHVVLDDENTGDSAIFHCMEYAYGFYEDPGEEILLPVWELGAALLRLTEDERYEAIELSDRFNAYATPPCYWQPGENVIVLAAQPVNDNQNGER